MKKRMMSILLAGCLSMGAFAGCGGGNGAAGGNGGAGGNAGGNAGSAANVTNDYELITVEGSTHQYKKYKDMTTENITLNYFHFDQDETVKLLADRFMKIYPNITVNVQYENVANYNTTLSTLVSNGEAPDIIMHSDCDYALSNMLLADVSAYFNSDEETKNLADTINSAGLGTYNLEGGMRYSVPVKFFPGAMFIDRNVLETLNLNVPTQNWTWPEMIQLIKDATVLDSPDGMAYYGLGYYNRLDSYYGIAARQDIIGEFGFNGKTFDLADWAVGEQEFSNLKIGGYIAPVTETQAMEDWCGDWEGWAGNTGHAAIFSEAFWTFQNTWNTPGYKDTYNLDIVPYVIPAVSDADAGENHHSIATIDYGGITTSCQYPREAYELLKFMSFGIDGWYTRCEIYADETIVNAMGTALKYDVMPVPITKDEGVWEEYIKVFCAGMDEEHTQLWRDYFKSCMQPISFGWTSIAGYWNFCDQYFNSIGIHDLVDAGTAQAADYVEEANRKANYYHAQAMLDYFGPNAYNVLTEAEIAEYEQMKTDNQ
ncbi:MAG: carbohydrate ABC transporter substrate-binding protein [Oscillospiraceae bacterium]|nr:carbohydrate ABC transporter substrate-binding protein [Oscillospiraceae bacterium]